MASLVNYDKSKQRIHKERSQLPSREHLGNLEKKKDYKLRAKANHEKKGTLKALRQKALERNPDEFYFHMINSRLEDGIHNEKEPENADTPEQEKLMKTQDLRYISYKLQTDRKKIEKSFATLHMFDPSGSFQNTRTVFVDGKAEAKKVRFKHKLLNAHPAKLSTLKTKPITSLSKSEIRGVNKEKQRAYDELCKRLEREKELKVVHQKLLTKKLVSQSSKDNKPVRERKGNSKRAAIFKWRLERQK